MQYNYNKGFNWCSFNIDDITLNELFTNVEKPTTLYPGRQDSGLVVYTETQAIVWQLETTNVFGTVQAKWSEDITLTHSKLYIIHFPNNCSIEIMPAMNIVPVYLPLKISTEYNWIGYYGSNNQSMIDSFQYLEKPEDLEEANTGLILFSSENSSVWQLESNTVFGNTPAQWSNDLAMEHGKGYILKVPKTFQVPKEVIFTYEDLDGFVEESFYTNIATSAVGPSNRMNTNFMNHTTVNEYHPNDKFYINNQEKPELHLTRKVYKFLMNNISSQDGKVYPMIFSKDQIDFSIGVNILSGSDSTFIQGVYFLDLRTFYSDELFYHIVGMPPSVKIFIE